MDVKFNDDGTVTMSRSAFFEHMGNKSHQEPQTKPEPKSVSLEQEVTNILNDIGFPRHLLGYEYIKEAITLIVADHDYLHSITQKLYPVVAQKFDTVPSRAERAIRHAIEVAWNRGNLETINVLFGNTVSSGKDKPTNSEFMALIADTIRLNKGEG